MIIIILAILVISTQTCPSSYYFSSALTTCLPCLLPCLTCISQTVCTSCSSEYYLQGNICSSCQAPCSTCSNLFACTTCVSGFYYDSGICQLCATNCLICSSAFDCYKCNAGMYSQGGVCTNCKQSCQCEDGTLQNCPNSTSKLLILTILIPILCIITVTIFICVIRNIRRKKEDQIKNTNQKTNQSFKSISQEFQLIGVMRNVKNKSWTFTESSKKINRKQICSICLATGPALQTKCGHLFHTKCLYIWVRSNRNCPMCKRQCGKGLKKYCKKCCKNYILCSVKNMAKFNAIFFDFCPVCLLPGETSESIPTNII